MFFLYNLYILPTRLAAKSVKARYNAETGLRTPDAAKVDDLITVAAEEASQNPRIKMKATLKAPLARVSTRVCNGYEVDQDFVVCQDRDVG